MFGNPYVAESFPRWHTYVLDLNIAVYSLFIILVGTFDVEVASSSRGAFNETTETPFLNKQHNS